MIDKERKQKAYELVKKEIACQISDIWETLESDGGISEDFNLNFEIKGLWETLRLLLGILKRNENI